MTAKAEAADAEDSDPQALPAEIARREALTAKLDAACARLEAEAKAQAEAERPEYEAKQAAYDARKGRRVRPPKPPDETPPADRQINLTDPDSQLMRKSQAHEYRQAYNAQAVVCAEGSQLILATNMATTPSDQPTFAATILAMEHTIGLPQTVLADAGFASGAAVAKLEAKKVEPLVAIAKTQPHRPYDFRPPPKPKPERRIREPWRLAMKINCRARRARPATRNANRPSNRSSASSKAPSASPASACAVDKRSPSNGCWSPWPTTAAGCTTCGSPEPARQPPSSMHQPMNPTAC